MTCTAAVRTVVAVVAAFYAGGDSTMARPSVPAGVAPQGSSIGAASQYVKAASPEQVVSRLESADPIVRRDARADLAKRGKAALPAIRKALQDPTASYRTRQGVIGALNDMQGIQGEDMGDEMKGAPFNTIIKAVGDSDSTVATEAYGFFSRYSIAGSAALGATNGGQERVRVKAVTPTAGDFLFLFSQSQSDASRAHVILDEIDCYEDSSGGTTRWFFAVFMNGQSYTIPEQRYGDAGRPQRYRLSDADRGRFRILVPLGRPNTIRVIGYKPKHL